MCASLLRHHTANLKAQHAPLDLHGARALVSLPYLVGASGFGLRLGEDVDDLNSMVEEITTQEKGNFFLPTSMMQSRNCPLAHTLQSIHALGRVCIP